MNVKQLSKYRQGVSEALACIEQGKDAHELLIRSRNRWYNQGVKEVLKESIHDSKIKDEYNLVQVNPSQYSVEEDGKHKYTIYKSTTGKWACSCPGFRYRNTCKHMELLDKELNLTTTRLPQHLARVRQLEKSLKVWQERLQNNPDSKLFQKNVLLRQQALEQAKKQAAEIEAMPKPQRHAREEFLGVIPLLNKLFEGLADYEIVGSWRRKKLTYKDCDILTVMDKSQWKELTTRLTEDPNFGPAPGHTHPDLGDDVIRGGYKNGDRWEYLDINRVTDPQNYGAWLLFRTGSAQFNIACRGWLKKYGCGLSEHGIKLPDGSYYDLPTEQEFFDWIGIDFIEPSQREDARKFYQEVKYLDKPKGLVDYEQN